MAATSLGRMNASSWKSFSSSRWVTLVWLLTWSEIIWVPRANAQEVVIHPSQQDSQLTLNALRGMFGMRLRTWPDGTPVKVFVLGDDSAVHQAFAKRVLQIFPHQLSRAWDRLVFSGTGQTPQVVKSAGDMLVRVINTPGAIGYLPSEMIDERVQRVEITGS